MSLIRSMFLTAVDYITPRRISRKYIQSLRQDHFAPHKNTSFEGHYSRIQTTDQGTIAIVVCEVRKAKKNPYLVHFSYSPGKDSNKARIKAEMYPEAMDKILQDKDPEEPLIQPYQYVPHNVGLYEYGPNRCTYNLRFPDPRGLDTSQFHPTQIQQANKHLHVSVKLTDLTHWDPNDKISTPEGPLVNLGRLLPLHWHVSSTRSKAEYTVRENDESGNIILQGSGLAHSEKNWGTSFPNGWIWSQSFSHINSPNKATYSLAGGRILGMEAFLIGYRSQKFRWDFRPPFTISKVFGFKLNLFNKEEHDVHKGTLDIDVRTFVKRLKINVVLPDDKCYMPLSCPLTSGHEPDYAVESFRATTTIRAYTRSAWISILDLGTGLLGGWELVETNVFDDGALEFGGDFRHE
ncbi:SDX1 [Acrasis kona]|uniref:SDX1 n=1 Tax=Acrasis kona TaxID=1008807 RepID=A0AAW2Z6D6_9EUKA